MSVAVVADAHLGGPGGPALRLVSQLGALPDLGCNRLVLLGDLFHVWVGARRYETPDVRAVIGALESLREQGLTIEYVEGNRDFFIGKGPYAGVFDRVAAEVQFEAGGRRFLAIHGDGLNRRDYAYRFWSWLSKSPPSRFFMLHLPRAVAARLVNVTERELAKTNFKHKSEIPKAVIERYARKRFEEGSDTLIMGHFHTARQWSTEGGRIVLLDAWFNSHKVELFGDGEDLD